ncbi:hypothetical protein [Aureibaculum conchae]|uniref:hypothetical protein n=1 Tax=Aureibaculum sp. 2308TA14-22 TaxID=3108392 RepID=UPI00339A51BF
MKNYICLVVLLILIGCKTITKEEYLSQSCECINAIETTDKIELKSEIADCLQDHFVNYTKLANKEIEIYLKENPNATRQDAQGYLVEMLHKELTEKCPTYKEANKKIEGL